MARGKLRVYLGAAPGVGKTYRMLDEGHRRSDRGTDVVIALCECHARPQTELRMAGLEIVARRQINYRGTVFTEMDLDAVLARKPQVALVDELAHTNVPGSRHAKRWQDVESLLEAGIHVITTLNVQHLESINDVVAEITGVPQRETVPDTVVRAAEQIELVDMTPEALRRRMAHGNIYRTEKIDAALGNYFRAGNLTALRELALLWLADKVDDQLDRYREDHHITRTWETRERVVVALTGGPEGETLIRRAARIAGRTKGADLLAVHVSRNDGLAGSDPSLLARQRALVENLGGSYHQVVGGSIPAALLDFARAVNATQLVLGASRRGNLAQLFSPGVGVTTTRDSGQIDVHLVTHEEAWRGRRWPRVGAADHLGVRQRLAGFTLALAGLPLLTVGLSTLRDHLSLGSDIMLYLAWTVLVALVGGLYPSLVAAVLGFLLLNFFFTPPFHRLTIAATENLLALLVFLAVAAAVASTVDRAARQTALAARARAEAETLSTLAGSVLRGSRPLPALLDQLRETFNVRGVSLLENVAQTNPAAEVQPEWELVSAVGDKPVLNPAEADVAVSAGNLTLALSGHPLAATDRRLVEAFAAQVAVALRQERLAEQAAAVEPLAAADRMRAALLSAVSHDLRTPLASAKAAVGSLRLPDVVFSPHDRAELLETADESLDRLIRLVENLLDMSRLQAGAVGAKIQAISVAETVAAAMEDLLPAGGNIEILVPEDLPDLYADPVLVERILANLLANALRYSPVGQPPRITAGERAGTIEIRVVDHGPGIPTHDRDRVFMPFQRLGDRSNDTGVGLGLALSRGLAEAMNGTLTPATTSGGGLTMILQLPAETSERARELFDEETNL